MSESSSPPYEPETSQAPALAPEPPTYKRITDPRELRALSHPLRIRLITELHARGQGSVTQLANAVGEPVNRVSFHLRQLAKYGLIAEAPELARDGRDRWWRLLYPDGVDWSFQELSASPEGRAVLRERDELVDAGLDEIRSALKTHQAGPGRLFYHDWYLRATPEQFAEFDREYIELCQRWRDRLYSEVAAEPDDGNRRTYVIHIFGFPTDHGYPLRPADENDTAARSDRASDHPDEPAEEEGSES